MIFIWLILLPLLTAFLAPIIVRLVQDNRLGWFLATVPFIMLAVTLFNSPNTLAGHIAQISLPWLPAMDVYFSFRLDGLSQLFVVLISGIGLPITIYSKPYFNQHVYLGRYYLLFFLFMMSMTGTVCANNLLTLFVFWEMTSICSFLLIGLNHRYRTARKAAIEALFITALGGLCLLCAFILLAQLGGTQRIDILVHRYDLIKGHPYFPWILGLFFIGVFTKSAQFPFSFWLPGAMKAPTPVSAYLHSATMVQLGIYLLGRFHPLFSESSAWFITLTTIGGVTMITGVLAAFKQLDMKLILAYTTVTALGSLVFSLGGNQEMIIKGAVSFLLVHALYKATLFMAVGDIQHQTGTRYLNQVSGLHRVMPITFLAVCVAAASMAGLPPLLGFYVKELVYEASLAAPVASYILTFVVVVSNMMMATIAFVFIIKPFWGTLRPRDVKEANVNMSVNALLVALITLFLSIFTKNLDRYILSPAAQTILVQKESVGLSPHGTGLTSSLILSLITLSGALILYFGRHLIYKGLSQIDLLKWFFPQFILQNMLTACLGIAKYWTTAWQSGYLNRYIAINLLSLCLLLAFFFHSGSFPLPGSHDPVLWVVFLWLVVTALSLLCVRRFLLGLIGIGVFGLGVSFFFVIQGAPDLAMTQALIETLMVILIVYSLSGQGKWPDIQSETTWHRWSRATIAISMGLLIAMILQTLLKQPFDAQLGSYFLENSWLIGHGRNVVNVILVDFRALDTLGEALVLLIAAVSIYFLLQNIARRKP